MQKAGTAVFEDRSLEGFLGGAVVKNPPANARDVDSIPALERFPWRSKHNSLQYSCLGNPTDRGAWQATVQGVTGVGHDVVTEQQSPRRQLVIKCASESHPEGLLNPRLFGLPPRVSDWINMKCSLRNYVSNMFLGLFIFL